MDKDMHINKVVSCQLSSPDKKKRLANIELLRMVSMFMVLMLHTRHPNTIDDSLGPMFCWAFSACGVDTFILISGYFGLRPSVKSWVHFLIPPTFYTLILCTINHEPITHYQPWCSWWFVTCYLELLLVAPFLNMIIDEKGKKMHLLLIFALSIINVYFGFICQTNEGRTGYTLMNFCFIYTLGRYINKYNIVINLLSQRLLLFVFLLFVNFIFRLYGIDCKGITGYYNSPLVILQAISLFLVFEKIEIKRLYNIILFISSSTFSVYLISDHPYFRYNYYAELWKNVGNISGDYFHLMAIFVNMLIFVLCTMLDKLRMLISDKVEQPIVQLLGNVRNLK